MVFCINLSDDITIANFCYLDRELDSPMFMTFTMAHLVSLQIKAC